MKDKEFIRYSLMCEVNDTYGICEVLRFIYDEIHEMEDKKKKEKIVNYLVDAMTMSKKIVSKLQYYRETYTDDKSHSGKNLKKLEGNVERRKMRESRDYETI